MNGYSEQRKSPNLSERKESKPMKRGPKIQQLDDVKLIARLLWQENLICQIPSLNKLFHNPWPNNYVWMLIPKNQDHLAYHTKVKRETSFLNIADELLLEACVQMVGQLGFDLSCHVYQNIENWRTRQRFGSNLDSIYFAEKIIEEIMQKLPQKINFSSLLKNEVPEVIDAFIKIPDNLKSLLRVNLYIPNEQVMSCLAALLREICSTDRLLLLFVDRIEIAKVGLRNISKFNYPTLILYLTPKINRIKNFHRVHTLFLLIARVAAKYSQLNFNSEYADPWLPNVTVTHGYRLYKRYLALIGMLPALYDERWNFAYVHGSDKHGCIPAVLSDTRQCIREL